MITYSDNVEKIVKALDRKNKRAMSAAKIGMVQGMEFFRSRILRNQMTGRPGLNVVTGTLRRSWFIRSRAELDDFITTLATETFYAEVHEKGMTIRAKNKPYMTFQYQGSWHSVKEVTIPKRLNVIEDFKQAGIKIISRQVAKNLFRAIK